MGKSMCTAVSTAFVESGELVFIENEQSWEQVGSQYFQGGASEK